MFFGVWDVLTGTNISHLYHSHALSTHCNPRPPENSRLLLQTGPIPLGSWEQEPEGRCRSLLHRPWWALRTWRMRISPCFNFVGMHMGGDIQAQVGSWPQSGISGGQQNAPNTGAHQVASQSNAHPICPVGHLTSSSSWPLLAQENHSLHCPGTWETQPLEVETLARFSCLLRLLQVT